MADLRAQLLAAFDVEHRDHLDAVRRALSSPADADLREMFRRVHSLKGAARAVDLPQIEAIAHRLEEQLAVVMGDGVGLQSATVDLLHEGLDAIEALAAAASTGAAPDSEDSPPAAAAAASGEPEPPPPSPPVERQDRALEMVRLDSSLLQQLTAATHELSAKAQATESLLETNRRLTQELQALQRQWRDLRSHVSGAGPARLHAFDNGLASLARDMGDLSRRHARAGWALDQGLEDLRRVTDEITLTPAENVLGDLGRMVRDIARDQGVEVDVRVEGLEVRAERRVLQGLREPIIHLLRNAVSHGAEPVEDRRKAGKPDRLQVALVARVVGRRLDLRILDDGAGPDLERIEAAAVARGLIPARARGAPAPPADDILALAFEPGVSAAAAVDRLSGRGMGLSAAHQSLAALGGSVRLNRRRPAGAEVVVTAPLSAARQTVILVEAGGAPYALPGYGVRGLWRLSVGALEMVDGAPSTRIQFEGSDIVTPVIPLAALLHDAPLSPAEAGAHVHALLLTRGERRLLLAVDALADVRELLIQPLESPRALPGLTLGAALAADDQPVFVLNPDALMERWMRNARQISASGLGIAQAAAPQAKRTVLVVDDSITTRTLEKSILEAHGYQVRLAVDGIDALNILRSGEAVFDVVVADIEMPRMDGFSLLQAIKSDASLARLPVILMTSRDDPADVRRGLDLGAEAYITKQKFDQRELLATIGRMI
ncbi:hybrid sensor histidine kinase/response regulator [Phenylobacterium sp.]|uniref:hybrid sensor histidine kinase/response regulator n=1 Tax=Phenylobacterium sp. TaxID=1871053 RepID=UPI002FDA8018